ncbi:hypothetical protein BKA60DRAFT_634681 [Fusarium oxysporum]|nr:hypothetical protein BKA60DRAFT_634681 [Fusarium oxysporum]
MRVERIPDEVGISISRWAPSNTYPNSSKPAVEAIDITQHVHFDANCFRPLAQQGCLPLSLPKESISATLSRPAARNVLPVSTESATASPLSRSWSLFFFALPTPRIARRSIPSSYPSSGSTRLPARITSTPPPSPLLPSLRLSITQHVRLDAKVGQSGAGLTAKPAGPTQPIYEHVLKPTSESAELKPGFEAAVKENLSGFSSSEHAAPKDSSSSPVRPILTDSPVAEPAGPTEPTSQ